VAVERKVELKAVANMEHEYNCTCNNIPSANLHSMERKTGAVSAALVEAGLTIVDYLVPLLLPPAPQWIIRGKHRSAVFGPLVDDFS